MAKKQTRRSISVSRGTYERLKAYCETNQISMSQFVERRVGDFLGRSGAAPVASPSAAPIAAPASQSVAADRPTSMGSQLGSPLESPLPVRTDAFEVGPHSSAPPPSAQHTVPMSTPAPTRLSSINQPLSQAVAASRPVSKPDSNEPLLKDPDAKLTAAQIFTF